VDDRESWKREIEDFEVFESAFTGADPIQNLKNYAVELSGGGMKRREIYDRFIKYFRFLIDAKRVDDETQFGEVLDMINDPHYGDFLDLPE